MFHRPLLVLEAACPYFFIVKCMAKLLHGIAASVSILCGP